MLENIELISIINKGGNLNYILNEISNFYDINTKKNFDINKFIKNYIGILLEKFNINSVNLYIDEDLLTADKNISAYHYLGDIYINSFFFKKPDMFFDDLITLTHEFQHLIDYENSFNHVRKVGENGNRIKLNQNDEILIELGMTDNDTFLVTYNTNECEYGANKFSYQYVLDLIEQSKKQIEPKYIEYHLLNIASRKIQLTEKTTDKIYNKYKQHYLPIIINKTKVKQKEWFNTFKKCVEKIYKNKDAAQNENFLKNVLSLTNKLYCSFSIFENIEILQTMQNIVYKHCNNNVFNSFLYIELLNYCNYVVTEKDIKKLNNVLKCLEMSVPLKEIKLESQNLKEHLINANFNNYDKNFENFTNINNIADYKNLINTYNTYLKTKNNTQCYEKTL